jgi:hypothetical protein
MLPWSWYLVMISSWVLGSILCLFLCRQSPYLRVTGRARGFASSSPAAKQYTISMCKVHPVLCAFGKYSVRLS